MAPAIRTRRRGAAGRRDEDGPALEAPDLSPAGRVLELQRSAGNGAVSRMLQRQGEGQGGWSFNPVRPGAGPALPGLGGNPLFSPSSIPEDLRKRIGDFIDAERERIKQRVSDGTISMGELVAQIRTTVAGAETLQIIQVESLVAIRLGPDAPPARRRQRGAEAAQAELQAKIANATKTGKGVTVKPEGGQITVSITGVEVSGHVGGAEVSAGVGPGGAKAEGKVGGVEAEVEAGPEKVEVTGKAHKVLFRAELEKDHDTHRWKGAFRLAVALVGSEAADEIPYAEELKTAVEGAHEAVGEAVRHVSQGGKPSDSVVRDKISGKVQPAIDAIGKAVQKRSAPNVTLGAEAKVGDPQLGVYAGVTLTITF